ncbi:hypothetical protein JCM10295v2_000891 [Rhodotorula toruloides]
MTSNKSFHATLPSCNLTPIGAHADESSHSDENSHAIEGSREDEDIDRLARRRLSDCSIESEDAGELFSATSDSEDLDESPATSAHSSPGRSSKACGTSPKDAIKSAHIATNGGVDFSRCTSAASTMDATSTTATATGTTSAHYKVDLTRQLGSGAGGDVWTDTSGTLAIKLVMPRANEDLDLYDVRFEEGVRESEAFQKLVDCPIAPSF